MTTVLNVLCAGAVQGLVKAMQASFLDATGTSIAARFGAVGAMQAALEGGAPCDVMIVTEAMVASLVATGRLRAGSMRPIGLVRTGIATRAGDPLHRVDTAESLKATLAAAPTLYVPDTRLSTAGKHVASVLARLGLDASTGPALAMFPNGATAMRELATHGGPGAIGCTQVTEILYTHGLVLAGTLPDPFGLATVYAAAVATHSADAERADRFIDSLSGPSSALTRQGGGFEPAPA